VAEEALSGVLRRHTELLESLLRLVSIGVRFLANRPEMSRKAVAQEVPYLGYLCSEQIETLKSGLQQRLFRGV
jgi:hypothetical protein